MGVFIDVHYDVLFAINIQIEVTQIKVAVLTTHGVIYLAKRCDCAPLLRSYGVELLWFDSMGAKSSSLAVNTSEGLLVIDPGAAAMQPSYPLDDSRKIALRMEAVRRIEEYVTRASAVIITHYHYDHHLRVGDPHLRSSPNPYSGKLLIMKDPNTYINASQWGRARELIRDLALMSGAKFEDLLIEPKTRVFDDPVPHLKEAHGRDWGTYLGRRRELLRRGRAWFSKLAEGLWGHESWVREAELPDGTRLVWGDGKSFRFGDVNVKVFPPWFHGIEYDRTGWVTPVLIDMPEARVMYSSDLMGPAIEDYASRIIAEKPDILILDGPPTYLFPYMLNRINLRRAVENAARIIRECSPELVIYDHHLLRERRWRKRVREVFEAAAEKDVELLTAAECLGSRPLIDTL